MKTVLICGVNGLIGAHLSRRLFSSNTCRVVGVSRHSTTLPYCHKVLRGDLCDALFVERIFQSEAIHEIYQLAADSGGAQHIYSQCRDFEIMTNSTLININLLRAARRFNCTLLLASSACVYAEGDRDREEWEAFPANPSTCYGWSKIWMELLGQAAVRGQNSTQAHHLGRNESKDLSPSVDTLELADPPEPKSEGTCDNEGGHEVYSQPAQHPSDRNANYQAKLEPPQASLEASMSPHPCFRLRIARLNSVYGTTAALPPPHRERVITALCRRVALAGARNVTHESDGQGESEDGSGADSGQSDRADGHGGDGDSVGGNDREATDAHGQETDCESDSIPVWGNGEQRRSFLHVQDAVQALQLLMASEITEPLNIASPVSVSVKELAGMIIGVSGKRLRVKWTPGPTGAKTMTISTRKAQELLKWTPSVDLQDGIREMYNWVTHELNVSAD